MNAIEPGKARRAASACSRQPRSAGRLRPRCAGHTWGAQTGRSKRQERTPRRQRTGTHKVGEAARERQARQPNGAKKQQVHRRPLAHVRHVTGGGARHRDTGASRAAGSRAAAGRSHRGLGQRREHRSTQHRRENVQLAPRPGPPRPAAAGPPPAPAAPAPRVRRRPAPYRAPAAAAAGGPLSCGARLPGHGPTPAPPPRTNQASAARASWRRSGVSP